MNMKITQEGRSRIRYAILFLSYIIFLLVLTLSPFEFSPIWLERLLSYEPERFLKFIFHLRMMDVMVNILLFIPFGTLLSLLLHRSGNEKSLKRFRTPIIAGGLLSGFIELAQLFLPRTSSILDLGLNIFGAILGYSFIMGWMLREPFPWRWMNARAKHFTHALTVVFWGIAFIILVFLPPRLNSLENWDESFPLIVGNEGTLDRPWEGDVFLIAIYRNALRHKGIQILFRSGWEDMKLEARRKMGLVALYPFVEGAGDTVHDFSGFGESLDIAGGNIRWLENMKGVAIREGEPLKSPKRSDKISQALEETCQMTVEAWIRTGNLVQSGPSRIVSISCNPDWRNFTLGQSGRDIHFRVRTPLTGLNGSWIHLKARSVLEDRGIHHLVATFHRGVERLFVDGQPKGGSVQGDIDYLPHVVKMGRNTAVKFGLCFIIFVPWNFLIYSFFNRSRFMLTLTVTGGVVLLTQVAYSLLFGQPFGWLFFGASVSMSVLGGGVGYIWLHWK